MGFHIASFPIAVAGELKKIVINVLTFLKQCNMKHHLDHISVSSAIPTFLCSWFSISSGDSIPQRISVFLNKNM